jgi:endonuclease V-like protein UPF0215 family
MRVAPRPHLLGIDDGPFEKFESESVPIVGVMMEGPDLVEAVALTRFGVDGEDVTAFLADWIGSLRFRPALHGVLFGGITIAGLAVLDAPELAARTGLPVLVVNRRKPGDERLIAALETAGLAERRATLARAPRPFPVDGLHVAQAGSDAETAAALVRAARGKSELPEPLRLAHLIARAVALGESRGRP